MPAALYMALTRSLLQAEARREQRPAAVLENVHQLLLTLGEANMFVTLFYAVIDPAPRQMRYARAGHDWPLLLRREGIQSLTGPGIPLGFPDLTDLGLVEQQVELQSGDRLVLYSDGLTDALDAGGRLFERDRLTAVLQAHAHLSAAELCQTTFAHLDAHQDGGKQYDDMTMLVMAVEE